MIDATPTKKQKLVYIGLYFIALMLLLHFLIMCRQRRQQRRYIGTDILAIEGKLRYLDRFPFQAI